ncbi:MAG: acetyl-CoA carboxylase biotin carboxyl carrier protein [Gammaproteobacteria bacterium]
MDIRKVKKLIEMLEESEVSEIEIHEGEESVRISRVSSAPEAAVSSVPQQVIQVGDNARPADSNPGIAETATDSKPPTPEAEPEGDIVESPMVGIFYEASAPGRAPFVELGQTVAAGDVMCVIEAMKIMNQVEAETGGTVSKIMVENGEPVEYGQPLFVLRQS